MRVNLNFELWWRVTYTEFVVGCTRVLFVLNYDCVCLFFSWCVFSVVFYLQFYSAHILVVLEGTVVIKSV